MSKLNNRQLLRFAAGSPKTRPAINEATESAAQGVADIDRLGYKLMRIKKFGLASWRELALRLYVWAEHEEVLDKVFPVEKP